MSELLPVGCMSILRQERVSLAEGIPAKGPFLGSVPGSHGSTASTMSGLQLATLSCVPVSTLMQSGSGATVGPARVGPSALQFGMEPTPVFGEVWRDLKSDS